MMNLFSTFDPVSSILYNWVVSMLLVMLIPCSYWLLSGKMSMFLISLLSYLNKEFKLNFSSTNTPGHTHWVLSIFLMLVLNNFLGLTPYTFTNPSHLSFSLTFGLTFWLSYLLYSFVMDLTHSLAHLVPVGTPVFLLPVMVLIESVSILIRPITLSVRLTANLVAGHLLMTLCAGPMTLASSGTYLIMIPVVVLLVLESAVSWIQAYVFSMLSSLYLAEVNFVSLQTE